MVAPAVASAMDTIWAPFCAAVEKIVGVAAGTGPGVEELPFPAPHAHNNRPERINRLIMVAVAFIRFRSAAVRPAAGAASMRAGGHRIRQRPGAQLRVIEKGSVNGAVISLSRAAGFRGEHSSNAGFLWLQQPEPGGYAIHLPLQPG